MYIIIYVTFTSVTEHGRLNKCIICNYVFKNNKKALHVVVVFYSEGI